MGNSAAKKPSRRRKIGLALAGGGLGGAVYEIGALKALEEALEGIDLNNLDTYVGVSAGGFICASLANHLTPSQMCRAIIKNEPGEHPFVPETFLTPAIGELVGRTLTVPRLLWEAVREYLQHPGEHTVKESLTHLARALPVGVFNNEPIRSYLHKIYSIKGRSDDFRELDHKLVVVAADLDSGEAVRFGEPPFDHIPISRAVQASTALPGLYPPVEIADRYYVDGVLLKTLHASVALESGAELVLCINPIVPVDTVRAVEKGIMKRGKLIDRGLVTVLSQTMRTLIRSRLDAGMARYEGDFQGADIILLEPKRDDYQMFFRNIFSFRGRQEVCEHAYQKTRAELLARYDELTPVLARHGIRLRREILQETDRQLWDHVGLPKTSSKTSPAVIKDLDSALAQLEELVPQS